MHGYPMGSGLLDHRTSIESELIVQNTQGQNALNLLNHA